MLEVCNDYDYMRELLSNEGFAKHQFGYDTCLNLKTDVGFFSTRIEYGYPRLVHFLVEPAKRSFKNSLKQFNMFTDMMISQGHPFFVVESPASNPTIQRFIKYIGGQDYYMEVDGDKAFYIPVGHRRKVK